LAALLAALDPEDEQDDDQDREGDQADEPQQGRDVLRRTRRACRAARTAGTADDPRPRAFFGRRLLLEEVEIDVEIALAHSPFAGESRVTLQPAPEGAGVGLRMRNPTGCPRLPLP